MNNQQCELLTMLLDARGKSFSYIELARHADVSARSIRNYITSINEFLAMSGYATLASLANGSVGYYGSMQEALLIRKRILESDFYFYKLSPAERGKVIIMLLLASRDFINIADMSGLLYVSKSTLLKDLEAVEAYFRENNVDYNPLKNKGYCLDITEYQRRELIVKTILPLMEDSGFSQQPKNIFTPYVIKQFNLTPRQKALEGIVTGMESYYGIQMGEANYCHFVLCLNIWTGRIEKGNSIKSEELLNKETENSIYMNIADYIALQVEKELEIRVDNNERCFLAENLMDYGLSRLQNVESYNVEIHIAVKSLLHSLSSDLETPIISDNELHNLLVNYLIGLLHGQGEHTTANQYSDELIRLYSQIHELFTKHLAALQDTLGYSFSEDEASVIFLYIITSVERRRYNEGAPNVIVVCNSGMAMANFLTERLRRSFNLKVVKTTSAHRLQQALLDFPHDFVISTVPLQLDEPWLLVSPTLRSEDILNVQAAIIGSTHRNEPGALNNNGQAPETAENSLSPSYILSPAHLALDVVSENWQSAICAAGQLLLQSGRIDEEYINAMVEVVRKNGPYIVFIPGVAIAHAESCDCNGFCSSLVRLKEPVLFGHGQNDPVRYVLAVKTGGSPTDSAVLFKLMNMMCDGLLVARLDMAQTPGEMYQAIEEYERTHAAEKTM